MWQRSFAVSMFHKSCILLRPRGCVELRETGYIYQVKVCMLSLFHQSLHYQHITHSNTQTPLSYKHQTTIMPNTTQSTGTIDFDDSKSVKSALSQVSERVQADYANYLEDARIDSLCGMPERQASGLEEAKRFLQRKFAEISQGKTASRPTTGTGARPSIPETNSYVSTAKSTAGQPSNKPTEPGC